jgi:non-specific protein-tyrosine kinase
VAESFRNLRTNITFTAVDKPLRRVMVTSPTPQVGKTTVLSNLAVVLAQGERKAIVLDADLRRPQIHRTFGLSNQIGLSNMFMRPMDVLLFGMIQMATPSKLAIITSGGLPPNPSELLVSEKMGQILNRLSEEYELVLVDTPPVLTVTDAAALAPQMDGILVVIKPGVTRNNELQQTLEQLQRVGGRVLGIVLNEVNPRSRRYGYYYHRYYSNYGYAYKEVTKPKPKVKKEPKTNPLIKRNNPVKDQT